MPDKPFSVSDQGTSDAPEVDSKRQKGVTTAKKTVPIANEGDSRAEAWAKAKEKPPRNPPPVAAEVKGGSNYLKRVRSDYLQATATGLSWVSCLGSYGLNILVQFILC